MGRNAEINRVLPPEEARPALLEGLGGPGSRTLFKCLRVPAGRYRLSAVVRAEAGLRPGCLRPTLRAHCIQSGRTRYAATRLRAP